MAAERRLFDYLTGGGRVVPKKSAVTGEVLGAYVMHTSNDAILGEFASAADAREAIALSNAAHEMFELLRALTAQPATQSGVMVGDGAKKFVAIERELLEEACLLVARVLAARVAAAVTERKGG